MLVGAKHIRHSNLRNWHGIQHFEIHNVKSVQRIPKFRYNLPPWTTQWSIAYCEQKINTA